MKLSVVRTEYVDAVFHSYMSDTEVPYHAGVSIELHIYTMSYVCPHIRVVLLVFDSCT
jgi:hypothetical protein